MQRHFDCQLCQLQPKSLCQGCDLSGVGLCLNTLYGCFCACWTFHSFSHSSFHCLFFLSFHWYCLVLHFLVQCVPSFNFFSTFPPAPPPPPSSWGPLLFAFFFLCLVYRVHLASTTATVVFTSPSKSWTCVSTIQALKSVKVQEIN